jgi:hypothetical protein
MEQNERYGRQMWEFVGKASTQLEDLVDEVNSADTTFTEVIKYYGEEDKNMSSAEFYGIFKTFVTSYKVLCKIYELINRNLFRHIIEMQVRQSDSGRGAGGPGKAETGGGRVQG